MTQPTASEGDECPSPTAGVHSDAEALCGEVLLADEPEASAAGETTVGDAKVSDSDEAAVPDDAVAEQEVELQEAELQEAVLEEAGAEPQPEEEAPGLTSTAHPTACGPRGGARGGEQKCEQKCEQAVLAPPPKRADLLPEEKAPSPQPPALAPTPLARHAPARCRSSLVRSFCHAGQ